MISRNNCDIEEHSTGINLISRVVAQLPRTGPGIEDLRRMAMRGADAVPAYSASPLTMVLNEAFILVLNWA